MKPRRGVSKENHLKADLRGGELAVAQQHSIEKIILRDEILYSSPHFVPIAYSQDSSVKTRI